MARQHTGCGGARQSAKQAAAESFFVDAGARSAGRRCWSLHDRGQADKDYS
jgi:hypothetical protein